MGMFCFYKYAFSHKCNISTSSPQIQHSHSKCNDFKCNLPLSLRFLSPSNWKFFMLYIILLMTKLS